MNRPNHHRPTKTRAAIDRFLHDLFYQLYDGPRRNLTAILQHHRLHYDIIQDLRELGALESVGTSRGQKHRWVGPYPDADLGDRVEQLRTKRRLERQQREKLAEIEEQQTVNDLLDLRNQIDQKLRELNTQPRLF